MFYGTHPINIDAKGRVIIPVRYRPDLEAGLFVTYGVDHCIWVLPKAKWDEVEAKAQAMPMPSNFKRLLFAGEPARLDSQGRLTLPAELRRYAGLVEEAEDGTETLVDTVIVTGAEERIEIWQPERWRAMVAKAGQAGEVFQEHLSKLGL